MSRVVRIDLSPTDYIHVPQAPRIERSPICSRGPGNEWQMWGVYGVTDAGDRVGLSNHTWSHLDAPFHLLPSGASFDQLDPRHYLALRTRVVDLAQTAPERRETIDGVDYHSRIDVADLPADLEGFDAVLFATGFSALYAGAIPMTDGADAHYPNVTADAARRLAGVRTLEGGGHRRPELRQAGDRRHRAPHSAWPAAGAGAVARDADDRAAASPLRRRAARRSAAHGRAASRARQRAPGRGALERLRVGAAARAEEFFGEFVEAMRTAWSCDSVNACAQAEATSRSALTWRTRSFTAQREARRHGVSRHRAASSVPAGVLTSSAG